MPSRRTTAKKRSRVGTRAQNTTALPLPMPLAARTRLPRTSIAGSPKAVATTTTTAATATAATTFPPSTPLLYTAQDVARFCEVDLKTIHHWADAGKIPHHRTEGRHLRFRRNHVLRFLHAHKYPLPAELVSVRPTVFVALPDRAELAESESEPLELTKKLSPSFFVRRFDNALSAIAHLALAEPDAIVLSLDDVTWAHTHAIAALKADPTTSWILLVVIAKARATTATEVEEGEASRAQEGSGADLVLAQGDLARLPSELATRLDVE